MTDLLNSNKILFALEEINTFLKANRVEFCLIGGLAVQIRGEPRFTSDIDICLLSNLETQEDIINLILKNFDAIVDDPKELALSAQLIPIKINQINIE